MAVAVEEGSWHCKGPEMQGWVDGLATL